MYNYLLSIILLLLKHLQYRCLDDSIESVVYSRYDVSCADAVARRHRHNNMTPIPT